MAGLVGKGCNATPPAEGAAAVRVTTPLTTSPEGGDLEMCSHEAAIA